MYSGNLLHPTKKKKTKKARKLTLCKLKFVTTESQLQKEKISLFFFPQQKQIVAKKSSDNLLKTILCTKDQINFLFKKKKEKIRSVKSDREHTMAT